MHNTTRYQSKIHFIDIFTMFQCSSAWDWEFQITSSNQYYTMIWLTIPFEFGKCNFNKSCK